MHTILKTLAYYSKHLICFCCLPLIRFRSHVKSNQTWNDCVHKNQENECNGDWACERALIAIWYEWWKSDNINVSHSNWGFFSGVFVVVWGFIFMQSNANIVIIDRIIRPTFGIWFIWALYTGVHISKTHVSNMSPRMLWQCTSIVFMEHLMSFKLVSSIKWDFIQISNEIQTAWMWLWRVM